MEFKVTHIFSTFVYIIKGNLPFRRELQEDAKLRVPALIKKYGYPVEVHHVESQNGYILEIHRIPYGNAEGAGPRTNKQVVFIQHGMLSSSADWVIAGPRKGLGYLLADLGYDVWMGNARGNRYSKNHKTLSPLHRAFWDFSWHEIGSYDLPAMIDYALKKSGQSKTYYIGYSQGTTAFYVMCSQKPEYNLKIRAMFSLAPVAYMSHMTSPLLKFVANFHRSLRILLKLFGINEFLPQNDLFAEMYSKRSITQFICTNSLFLICGFNSNQMNTQLLPIIMGHNPAGSSTKQFLHYAQCIKSGKFRQFDYGVLKNLFYYKSFKPPSYDLSKVTAPVSLHYSQNDWLTAELDVLKLYEELANPIGVYLVTDRKFNHLDYMWAKDVDTLVYNKIFTLMRRI